MEKWVTWVAGWEMYGFWSSSIGGIFLSRSGILWKVFSHPLINRPDPRHRPRVRRPRVHAVRGP